MRRMSRLTAVVTMDEYEADQIGSDNPAQSIPAAQRIPFGRRKSGDQVKAAAKQSEDGQSTVVSDTELTKYDV